MDWLLNIWRWWELQALPGLLDGCRATLPAAWTWTQYDFMLKAVIECILLTPICAAMGVKVVNFRMAFFSDAIAHSAFAGVALGFLINETLVHFDPRISLIIFGLVVGLGIAAVRRKTDLSSDTVIGVFFSTVIAFGLAIIAGVQKTGAFEQYLYGSILTLDAADLGLTALLAGAVMVFMLCGFNKLALIGLNDELAHSRGVPVRLYDYVFTLLLALVVTVSIRTVGILLVTALLIVPAATARNIAGSAGSMFRWSMLIGLVSGISGTLISFSWFPQVGTGAMIILAAAFLFVLSFAGQRD